MATTLEEPVVVGTLPASAPRGVTFEEYLAWDNESGYHEWVDGQIVTLPNPSLLHQQTVGFLLVLLLGFNAQHKQGTVIQVPFAMRLAALNRVREPDLLFVAQERTDLFTEFYLDGAADVAVEVTSPGTRVTDRGEKYFEYEAIGIKEYWLIDPDRHHAEFYQLGADYLYQVTPLEAGGIFRSEVLPGFWLRVDWLWNKPNELDALRELGVI